MSTWYLIVELEDGDDLYCEGCPNLNAVEHMCNQTYCPLTLVSGEEGDVHLRPDDGTCQLTKMDDSDYEDDGSNEPSDSEDTASV